MREQLLAEPASRVFPSDEFTERARFFGLPRDDGYRRRPLLLLFLVPNCDQLRRELATGAIPSRQRSWARTKTPAFLNQPASKAEVLEARSNSQRPAGLSKRTTTAEDPHVPRSLFL